MALRLNASEAWYKILGSEQFSLRTFKIVSHSIYCCQFYFYFFISNQFFFLWMPVGCSLNYKMWIFTIIYLGVEDFVKKKKQTHLCTRWDLVAWRLVSWALMIFCLLFISPLPLSLFYPWMITIMWLFKLLVLSSMSLDMSLILFIVLSLCTVL